jgi:hypothetical protein
VFDQSFFLLNHLCNFFFKKIWRLYCQIWAITFLIGVELQFFCRPCIFLSVSMSVFQSSSLSVCQSITLSLFLCLSVCLSGCLSVNISLLIFQIFFLFMSVCQSVCQYLSVCLFVCLSVFFLFVCFLSVLFALSVHFRSLPLFQWEHSLF